MGSQSRGINTDEAKGGGWWVYSCFDTSRMKTYISYEMYTYHIQIHHIYYHLSWYLKIPPKKCYVVKSDTKVRGANLWLRKVWLCFFIFIKGTRIVENDIVFFVANGVIAFGPCKFIRTVAWGTARMRERERERRMHIVPRSRPTTISLKLYPYRQPPPRKKHIDFSRHDRHDKHVNWHILVNTTVTCMLQ